ncbi:neutral zinc metallopeptidase [Nocardia takedensis]
MDNPLTVLPDRVRRGRMSSILVYGVVATVLAAAIMLTGRSCGRAEQPQSARTAAAVDGIPGFHGLPSEGVDPVRDAAPPVAGAPLAGEVAEDRAVHALADHPLFARHVGVHRVDCALPSWRDDQSGARAFYLAAIACLDASWEPTLRGAGLPFRSPRLQVPESIPAVRGLCAPGDTEIRVGHYCPSTETILLPMATVRPAVADSRRGAQLAALAHEYGHHIQSVIGVTRAYRDRRTTVGWDSAAGLELSRRLELQAACFSGMFLGTNAGRVDLDESSWTEAAAANRAAGDRPGEPRARGTDATVWGWWKWGSDTGDTWECNTWYAAAAHVD